MKLYYLAGACSMAAMISLIEAGLQFEAVSVDRGTRNTSDGKAFSDVNPKGYVPALVLDNGELLTENVAVLSYIVSQDQTGKLGPKPGSTEYIRLLEWLAYVNSEVHKSFGPLFRPDSDENVRKAAKELIARRLGFIEKRLDNSQYLMGDNFSVADAYLFVILSWRDRVGVSIAEFPHLIDYYERIRTRPSVAGALKIQGLA